MYRRPYIYNFFVNVTVLIFSIDSRNNNLTIRKHFNLKKIYIYLKHISVHKKVTRNLKIQNENEHEGRKRNYILNIQAGRTLLGLVVGNFDVG